MALGSLAHVAAERGHVEEGVVLCAEALALPDLSGRERGLVHAQCALLAMRRGDLDAALGEFDQAARLLVGEPDEMGRLHLNRGNVQLQIRDAAAAATDFHQARTLAHDPVERAKATHNLGYARLLEGDLAEALGLIDEAAPVLAPLSPVSAATVESDRAEVFGAAGMPRAAAQALTEAAACFARRRLRQYQAEALLAKARWLILVDPMGARGAANAAARLFRGRGSHTWALQAEAVRFEADVRRRLERPGMPSAHWREGILAMSDDLLQRLDAGGVSDAAERVRLVRALAEVSSQESTPLHLPRIRRRVDLGTQLLNAEVQARAAWRRGRNAAAFDRVRGGLNTLHQWQSGFGSLELQSSLVGHGRRLAVLGMSKALSDGRPSVVFEWSERSRALAARVPPVRVEAEETRRRAATLAALRESDPELGNGRPHLAGGDWRRPGSGQVVEPVSLDQVTGALGDDALISHLVSRGQIWGLTVTRDAARLHRLGPLDVVEDLMPGLHADLDMAATPLSASFAQVIHEGVRSRLDDLERVLFRPLLADVGDSRLVLTPSGRLAGIPWTMLRALRGRPVVVARSASSWVTAPAARVPRSAGFVVGPDVDRAPVEMRECAQAWGDRAWGSADPVGVGEAQRLAAGVDLLHVAAHGQHSDEHPLFSGVRLEDGTWFGHDVDLLPGVPDSVILSACEVGRSSLRWAEELLGATVSWLHAGARGVIASPVALSDESAADVFPRLHGRLAAGAGLAEALAATEGAGDLPLACHGAGW